MYSDPLVGLRNNSEISQTFRILDAKHDDLRIRQKFKNFVKFRSYFWDQTFSELHLARQKHKKNLASASKTEQFIFILSLSFAAECSNR